MKQFAVVCIAIFVFISAPEFACAEDTSAEHTRLRQVIDRWLPSLGAAEFEARERGTTALIALGLPAVPLLASHAQHRDPEVAVRIRRILAAIRGTPGEAVEGLTLSAAPVGHARARGEPVTLWLTIANTSDKDIHLFRYMWRLSLLPAERNTVTRSVGANTPATLETRDFIWLAPGESFGLLMDADMEAGAATTDLRAYLEVSVPTQDQPGIPKPHFTGASELVSGSVTISFSNAANPIEPNVQELWTTLAKKNVEADETIGRSPLLAAALRYGLCHPDAHNRARAVRWLGLFPKPELEDALIDALARLGPRITNEDERLAACLAFAEVLPPERKWPFLHRFALATAYDWRSLNQLLMRFSSVSDPVERANAARLGVRLHDDLGLVLSEGQMFTAWEIFTTADATMKNTKKATELAREVSALEPNNPAFKFALAAFSNDAAAMKKIMDEATTSIEQNSIAWDLVSRFPVGSVDAEWAISLATKAVGGLPLGDENTPHMTDTLAATYAFKGDYSRAAKEQERAFKTVTANDRERPGMARRTVYFTALALATPEERPRFALDPPKLRSPGARDALLERWKRDTDPEIRKSIRSVLVENFAADPEVQQMLKSP